MRLGVVIGRVTLGKTAAGLEGARWLIVSPYTREQYHSGKPPPSGAGKEATLVVYDDLGGDAGQTIGFVEGREASAPFDQPTPIDAINAALVDRVYFHPFSI
jgi:microcompartment protein CcmK/EutM